jgi:hypothetical protein
MELIKYFALVQYIFDACCFYFWERDSSWAFGILSLSLFFFVIARSVSDVAISVGALRLPRPSDGRARNDREKNCKDKRGHLSI